MGELVGQIIDLSDEEFKVDYPTWRGFLPKEYWAEIENPKETDWIAYFSDPNFEWGRFEFDIELEEMAYVQGVTFNIETPYVLLKS